MSFDATEFAATYAAAFEDGRSWTAQEFENFQNDSQVNIIGDAASFCIIRCVADEAEVLTIATRPHQQGQGLGRARVLAACDAARIDGVKTVFLEVAADNAAALHLYETIGFADVGRRKSYYRRANGQTVDAIVMSLDLSA